MIINRATNVRPDHKDGIFDYLDEYVFGPLNLINRLDFIRMWLTKRNGGHRFKLIRADAFGGEGSPKSFSQCKKILNDAGINVYATTHSAHYFYFSVSKKQAAWAEYVLLRSGIGEQLENPTSKKSDNIRTSANHSGPVRAWKDRPKTGRRRRTRKRRTRA